MMHESLSPTLSRATTEIDHCIAIPSNAAANYTLQSTTTESLGHFLRVPLNSTSISQAVQGIFDSSFEASEGDAQCSKGFFRATERPREGETWGI